MPSCPSRTFQSITALRAQRRHCRDVAGPRRADPAPLEARARSARTGNHVEYLIAVVDRRVLAEHRPVARSAGIAVAALSARCRLNHAPARIRMRKREHHLAGEAVAADADATRASRPFVAERSDSQHARQAVAWATRTAVRRDRERQSAAGHWRRCGCRRRCGWRRWWRRVGCPHLREAGPRRRLRAQLAADPPPERRRI